ncbi:glycosyltransferase family 4 protein [Mycobacterium kyogaense]|uniref:glycosyltransferase family 4 protein n=1 Tax=Mycobacterium kyogaense TaxID=2212479 RepID=UPI001968DA09|nr:glycosyltransferase family 4 protein [Mycobacterium kyogaense]
MRLGPLKIGIIAPPWASVPPPAYGGTESVVSELVAGLAAAGQEVILYATADSTVPVPLVRATARSTWDRIGHGEVELPHVMEGYEALTGCDIIHDHTLLGPSWALASGHHRVVTTSHGPLNGELNAIYRRYAKRIPVIAISRDQAQRAPEVMVDRVIHHGLDPASYPVGNGDGGFLLFLGRMTPDKGVRQAALAARAAGRRLVVAAKSRENSEQAYFHDQVEPLLGDNVEFIGEVGGQEKLELLGAATALLNPIQWPEPFGLVMIEALACGTPVIASPTGAAPEIVDDGVTGFLCSDGDALVRAIGNVDQLSRRACRDAVVKRFSTDRMVRDHLALYRELVSDDVR